MRWRHRGIVGWLSGALWLLGLVPGGAQSPFSVAPSWQTTEQGRVLQVWFEVPPGHFLYADKLSVRVEPPGLTAAFTLPEPTTVNDPFSATPKRVFASSFAATCPWSAEAGRPFTLVIRYQGCDEANCFFPEGRRFRAEADGSFREVESDDSPEPVPQATEWKSLAQGFTVAARASGYLNERQFLGFLRQAQRSGSAARPASSPAGSWGTVAGLIVILLGGLALNLTPCVLPMIPINLAILGVGAKSGSRARGLAMGAAYGAGMAATYGALGVVVVLTGAKFGALNSSAAFNLAIAAVFVVLGLAMFDLFQIDLSRWQRRRPARRDAGWGAFVVAGGMGALAALLAGACVAPVVISALVQATALYSQGVVLGLALPFLLGVGMALPWPFAGAGLSFLPKPGPWMTRVKQGFGVLILLFALYYGHLGYELFAASRAREVLASSAGAGGPDSATAALAAALEESQADRRPLVIDFGASWCKNCAAMEHTTLRRERVRAELMKFRALRFPAEQPSEPATKEVLDFFGVLGLPTYVVLTPKPPSRKAAAPAMDGSAQAGTPPPPAGSASRVNKPS